MRTMCSREIITKKYRQQQIFQPRSQGFSHRLQIFDSDLKGAWHYNQVTFTPIAKNFMLYCRLIYMLSILCVRLTIKVKVGIPESFKVGWYHPKKTGLSHLKYRNTVRKIGKYRNTVSKIDEIPIPHLFSVLGTYQCPP